MKKSYFLMLMALAFMFSCRTENMDENNLQKNLEKTSQAKFITKTVSLSGKDEIVQKSNILYAFKNNKTNTTELDYKHVEYIETAGKKTYTFKILNSDAPGSFQNLVVIQYPDGTIKKKIITYSASENEKESMLMGNMVNFSGKVISVTDLDDAAPNNTQGKYYESGGKCYSESIEVSPCGSGQHNASNMDQWDKCTHPVKAKLIVTVEEVPCGSGGSSSTGTGIGTDYGNDTQNPDNGGIDFPTAPTLTNLQFILFVNTLPQNLQDVVNNVDYLDFYTGLNNYFYYSNKTAAAKAFITWALQFKLANPDTSWEQFQNWFIDGYNTQHQKNIIQLSPAQIQEYKNINSAINYSQLGSQELLEVQGANYLYAMLYAYNIPSNPSSQNIQSALNSMCCPFPPFISFPQVFTQNEINIVASNYIFLRKHTNWDQATCMWEASKEAVHFLLDLGGLVPAFGEFCDLSNATIYAIDGDWDNAAWSTGSAIPIAGWLSTGKKFTIKFANISNKVILNMVVDGGIIKFGNRSKLRQVLQLTDSSIHAHHIIPWEWRNHPLIQKAAFALQGFHMNDVINGIPLPTTAHLTGHQAYNQKVFDILEQLDIQNPNPAESYNKIIGFTNYLKNLIQNNPNKNLGEIAAIINYP
ncbi:MULTISPECIES: AHH domain-containing protein [unclassified Chryseobacterium]|uniref:AHH domain-containing protein n=1 Tax=unclassified Chryseobacterium TaxID=2593645 RepID=UPI00301B5034